MNIFKPKLIVQLCRLGARVPTIATDGSGAYDFYTPEEFHISARSDIVIGLGLMLQFNKKYALVEVERSSTARNKKCIAGAKFIDSDYRGEIHVHLFNLSNVPVHFDKGDRVIQGYFIHTNKFVIIEGLVNTNTKRGNGAFGSTGK